VGSSPAAQSPDGKKPKTLKEDTEDVSSLSPGLCLGSLGWLGLEARWACIRASSAAALRTCSVALQSVPACLTPRVLSLSSRPPSDQEVHQGHGQGRGCHGRRHGRPKEAPGRGGAWGGGAGGREASPPSHLGPPRTPCHTSLTRPSHPPLAGGDGPQQGVGQPGSRDGEAQGAPCAKASLD
jgi:hypothetical protein